MQLDQIIWSEEVHILNKNAYVEKLENNKRRIR